MLAYLTVGALRVTPTEIATDCRDAKDNKDLELALAGLAAFLVASDEDLLALHPWHGGWHGLDIVTPSAFVEHFESAPAESE